MQSVMKTGVIARGTTTLFLDMNGTFMFEHDRLDDSQDFFATYELLGGKAMHPQSVCEAVNEAVARLSQLYDGGQHDLDFQGVRETVGQLCSDPQERELLTRVIAAHELGSVADRMQQTVRQLSTQYQLVLLSNLWSDSENWRAYLESIELTECFEHMVFSSDIGINKPAGKIFEHTLRVSGADVQATTMIGDSYERDVVPAAALGMKTIWVTSSATQAHIADAVIPDFTTLLEAGPN